MEVYKAYLTKLLKRRVDTITARAERIQRRYIDRLTPDAKSDQYDREWLEQYAQGNGLDIACGDFPIGNAQGVDGDEHAVIGADWVAEGDELTFQQPGTLDYVVTNYLDAFPNPLKALNEWYRVLRTGGIFAIVCRNAEAYPHRLGPLENQRRQALYTTLTLSQYLYRAGFSSVKVEAVDKTLRATAVK